MVRHKIRLVPAIIIVLSSPLQSHAQGARGGGGRGQAPSPRAAAPIDLTGNWVSLITEDWRFRMVVAQKGDWDIIPLNDEGRKVAEAANPAQDEAAGNQCKAYGAAGIMRVPGRLRITWDNDTTLRIEADAGMQTRVLQLGPPRPSSGEPTWQGHSVGQWELFDPRPDIGGKVSRGGQLKVTTTNMRPGYYFKHGVPYSGNAVMTEYFSRLSEANGDEYIMVTAIVDDPTYLTQQFVKTLVFKREPDGSKWKPAPCSAR